VREDADLDFKQEGYGNSDSTRREMAADIAAMANERGGLIIIGIRGDCGHRWRLRSLVTRGAEATDGAARRRVQRLSYNVRAASSFAGAQ
jgi:Putative DNA-binding domain